MTNHADLIAALRIPMNVTLREGAPELDEYDEQRKAAAAALEAIQKSNEAWRKNSLETWSAMQAMRDAINEYIPMPSLESNLLQGPENSVFCANIAEAVIVAIVAIESVCNEAYRRGQEDMRERAAEVLRDKWASTTAEHEEDIRALAIKEKDDE